MSKMFRNLTVIISSETNFVGGKSTKTHVCISDLVSPICEMESHV